MPKFSGVWTPTAQMQARGASTWPAKPGAPTIGTATAGGALCASVTFAAPACVGYPASGTEYRVVSTPGCFTQTGTSSPLVVSGLTLGTSYTFKAQATNASGYGALSASSNAIAATLATCAAYTTAGTYSFVVPSGVTSIATVVVGGGSSGGGTGGGGGGALSYVNAISVTPLETLTVSVGAGGASVYGPSYGKYGGISKLARSATTLASTVQWTGCSGGSNLCFKKGQTVGVGTGGVGGTGNNSGAGAGGYAGAGANGQGFNCGANAYAGAGGGGGAGRGGGYYSGASYFTTGGGGGGGVGLYGQGSNGLGGTSPAPPGNSGFYAGGGGGGSCGGSGGGASLSTASIRTGGSGGLYGGGGGATANSTGGGGAVRIVWCVSGLRGAPSFPSTNVGP